MIAGIDHIVIVVPDLTVAAGRFRELGFTVQPGGVHGGGASHNALVGFTDGSYLELFAFLDTTNARNPAWLAALGRGGGVTDLCVRTDNLATEVARLQAAGLPYPEPRAMSRHRPDGQTVAWRLSVPPRSPNRWLPFVIEDDTPRELRVPSGPEAVHPNGVTGIARVEVRVASREAIARDLAVAFDASPHWAEEEDRGQFTVGPTTLDCAAASPASTAVLGPFRVTFATPHAPTERIVENAHLVL